MRISQSNTINSKGENNPMFGVHRMGEQSPNFNRIWINDGVNRKMVNKLSPIPEGYTIGYKLKQQMS